MDKLALYLTTEEINLVLAGLQELPHRVADPILRNILDQANSQMSQPEGPETTTDTLPE